MKQQNLQKARELLAKEYHCAAEDFRREENRVTAAALHPERRVYSSSPYFFHMACMGKGTVITADPVLHPFLTDYAAGRTGHWLFEQPNLLQLEKELNRHGHTLTQTYHMFLSGERKAPKAKRDLRWYFDDQIHPFYGDPRFPNAIGPGPDCPRPDRIVVCAMDGGTIMGMAGASQDAPGWMQIGIDVMPEYRSCGVATDLVILLKEAIVGRGQIPFYGTSLSNYHSWNVAINSGFFPAWVEIGSSAIG